MSANDSDTKGHLVIYIKKYYLYLLNIKVKGIFNNDIISCILVKLSVHTVFKKNLYFFLKLIYVISCKLMDQHKKKILIY